jgi:hypothetical protein
MLANMENFLTQRKQSQKSTWKMTCLPRSMKTPDVAETTVEAAEAEATVAAVAVAAMVATDEVAVAAMVATDEVAEATVVAAATDVADTRFL